MARIFEIRITNHRNTTHLYSEHYCNYCTILRHAGQLQYQLEQIESLADAMELIYQSHNEHTHVIDQTLDVLETLANNYEVLLVQYSIIDHNTILHYNKYNPNRHRYNNNKGRSIGSWHNSQGAQLAQHPHTIHHRHHQYQYQLHQHLHHCTGRYTYHKLYWTN